MPSALLRRCCCWWVVFCSVSGSTYTVLYTFNSGDGSHPQANLVFDKAGNLYGTTSPNGISIGPSPRWVRTPARSGRNHQHYALFTAPNSERDRTRYVQVPEKESGV
jgi:hypothetical protein